MLDISLSGLLWTVINLFVLYLLLKKFLWKPVTAIIESRQEEIEHNLSAADEQRRQAEKARLEYDERLALADKDAGALVRQGKERGDREYQSIVAAAKEEAKALTEKAQTQLEADRAAMLAEARREVAALVLMTASKVSAHSMSDEEDRALVDAFLSDAGEII